jgi:hypothetical protein
VNKQSITLANILKQREAHLKHIPVFSVTFLSVKLMKNVTILVQVVVDVYLYREAAVYGRIIDLKAIRCEGVDWINITQDGVQCQALVNMVMNLEPSGFIKRSLLHGVSLPVYLTV